MTELDPELRRLLEPLRASDDVQLPERTPEARARILAAMRTEVRALPARQKRATTLRRLTLAAPVLAAAASFALVYQGRAPAPRVVPNSVHVASTGTRALSWSERNHQTRTLHGEGELHGDGELDVPAETSAALTTATGVHMMAEARTRLRLQTAAAEGAQRVRLHRGALRCQVPPLGKGRSFVVDTAHASVVVHGTDFRVEQGATDAAPCVRVSEGLVEVQRANEASVWLGPGQTWSCDEPAHDAQAETLTPPVPPSAEARELVPAREERATRAHKSVRSRPGVSRPQRRGAEPTHSESTLERENSLLARALQAEQQGDAARARALFESLLATFPRSPLAPEARAGLLRTHTR